MSEYLDIYLIIFREKMLLMLQKIAEIQTMKKNYQNESLN